MCLINSTYKYGRASRAYSQKFASCGEQILKEIFKEGSVIKALPKGLKMLSHLLTALATPEWPLVEA